MLWLFCLFIHFVSPHSILLSRPLLALIENYRIECFGFSHIHRNGWQAEETSNKEKMHFRNRQSLQPQINEFFSPEHNIASLVITELDFFSTEFIVCRRVRWHHGICAESIKCHALFSQQQKLCIVRLPSLAGFFFSPIV